MDLSTKSATTPESMLLKKVERELALISEEQHAAARHAAILRKARTLLHLGSSSIEVNAMLTDQLGKDAGAPKFVRRRTVAPRPSRPQLSRVAT